MKPQHTEANTVTAPSVGSGALFGTWEPMATAPRDREILIAWGTNTSGAMGWDVVKYKRGDRWESTNGEYTYPADSFAPLAWQSLPPLPNVQDDPRR